MEEVPQMGLITDNRLKYHIINNILGSKIEKGDDYHLFVSKKHGGGAGKYKINEVVVDENNITIHLNFEISPIEAGAGVVNQRLLLFKIEKGCMVKEINVSYAQDSLKLTK